MRVRPKKRAPVQKGNPPPKQPAGDKTFPAPLRGWILNESLAAPQPGGAAVLDNYICTTTGIRPRGGSSKVATLIDPVQSLMTYKSGTQEILFGATDAAIYDVSGVSDPDITPAPVVIGQTSGRYSADQIGTAGGDFLYAVNGTDAAQLYNGTTWQAITDTTTPSLSGVSSASLSDVWKFANRLFFVEKNTMRAWYLPVDSIGGALSSFSLAGVFSKGGTLSFGSTWSLDAGDGLDDKCVFVSTEGEVAIYEGTNPASAADWRKAGVFDVTRPLGKNATMQAGGDLIIATEVGAVPLSEAINRDPAALALNSVSRNITPYWQARSEDTREPWEIIKWPQNNIMIVSQPNSGSTCLVANLQTGAWSRITGWQTNCLGYYDERGYFGGLDGNVYLMDVTGTDSGVAYTCSYLGLHDDMQTGGRAVTVHQARAIFQATTPISPKVGVQVNYSTSLSAAPASVPDYSGDTWDSGRWDVATWDATPNRQSESRWVSIGRTGYAIAPEVQLTFDVSERPVVELAAVSVTYDVGALVT